VRSKILDRYLLTEATAAWIAVTFVLLSIMLSTRFTRALAQAAAGNLPKELLFEVAALSSLQYLVILIPFSLMLAIMLALGRLYRDSEVAAMMGCGVGMDGLYRPFLVLGVVLAALTALLAFHVGPWAGRTSDYLVKNAARLIQYNPFEAGQFKEVAAGRAVFYTASAGAQGGELGQVFAQINESSGSSVLISRSGRQQVGDDGRREVVLHEGYRYKGEPGSAVFDIMRFDEFRTYESPPDFFYMNSKRSLQPTANLVGSGDPEDQAELAWRMAAPVSVFILGLLAVPLSHVGPRQGRYGKLVLGIVIYVVYAQLMGLGQTWIAKGYVPGAVGLWWIHALVLTVAIVLTLRRLGWRLRA
jgi:lipopolysaccharide export system permease protein